MGGRLSRTRDEVRQAVERQFGARSLEAIMTVLDQYQAEPGGRERVQMAILKLSGGDLEKLRHYLKRAQDDFRDVLYWAEYES